LHMKNRVFMFHVGIEAKDHGLWSRLERKQHAIPLRILTEFLTKRAERLDTTLR
jgi:hypothetical protein